mmetsp:Transcript_35641/g.43638  ORF Transcript_35641/g.43638 Transcript_35641/m.43638 type:complete len:203 (-) Transcript_35641:326-934(-)
MIKHWRVSSRRQLKHQMQCSLSTLHSTLQFLCQLVNLRSDTPQLFNQTDKNFYPFQKHVNLQPLINLVQQNLRIPHGTKPQRPYPQSPQKPRICRRRKHLRPKPQIHILHGLLEAPVPRVDLGVGNGSGVFRAGVHIPDKIPSERRGHRRALATPRINHTSNLLGIDVGRYPNIHIRLRHRRHAIDDVLPTGLHTGLESSDV